MIINILFHEQTLMSKAGFLQTTKRIKSGGCISD